MHRLQIVQNQAARLIKRTRKRDHITPVLKELHWLPVEKRIVYKVCLSCYKALNGQAPGYIKDFLQERTFQVRVDQALSETKEQTNGTPQGSVISPTLFNVLVNDVSKIEKNFPQIAIGQFADDISTWVKADHAPKKANK